MKSGEVNGVRWELDASPMVLTVKTVLHGEVMVDHIPSRRAEAIIAALIAATAAERAEKEKGDRPRFPKPEGCTVFLGRCDRDKNEQYDAWLHKSGRLWMATFDLSWECMVPSPAQSGSPRAKADALLAAHLAKVKEKKVIVGWRVKDLDPDTNWTYAGLRGEWIRNGNKPHTFATREEAMKRLHEARRQYPVAVYPSTRIRLVLVTRRNPDDQAQHR